MAPAFKGLSTLAAAATAAALLLLLPTVSCGRVLRPTRARRKRKPTTLPPALPSATEEPPPTDAAFASLRLPNPSPVTALDLGDASSPKAALLVVDVQTCWYTNSPLVRTAFPHLPEKLEALLALARRRGLVVVHIRADYDDSPHVATMRRLNPGLNRCAITPEAESWAEALPGERVVLKSTFDGFLCINLETMLRNRGVSRVLVAGLVTSACVLSTALGAFHRGFDVLLVSDACADRSVDRHEATLALYSDYVFRTVRMSELARCGGCASPPPLRARPSWAEEATAEQAAPPCVLSVAAEESPMAEDAATEEAAFCLFAEGGVPSAGQQYVSPSTTLDDLQDVRQPSPTADGACSLLSKQEAKARQRVRLTRDFDI